MKQNLPKKNNIREGEKGQVKDPLDEIEDLETERRKILKELVDSFVKWGESIGKSRRIIEEMKRKKFIRNSHEIKS